MHVAAYPKVLSFKEKIKLFVFRDATGSMSRILIGGVLGAFIGSGAGVVAAIGAGLIGLTALANIGVEQTKKRLLANLYCDEISAALGKPKEEVSAADIAEMARTPEEGGRGSYAIDAAVNSYARVRNFNIAVQAITAGIMIAGLAAVTTFFPAIPVVAIAGVASVLYNEVYESVRTGGEILTNVNEGTITRDIRAISDQINLGGRISSTRVLAVFVKANPQLADEIQQKHGMDYEMLNVATKRELVQQYDKKYNLFEIKRDINDGFINPTELAFLAYGQTSGRPRREQGFEKDDIVARTAEHTLAPGHDKLPPHEHVGASNLSVANYLDSDNTIIARETATSPTVESLEQRSEPQGIFTERLRQDRLSNPFKTIH